KEDGCGTTILRFCASKKRVSIFASCSLDENMPATWIISKTRFIFVDFCCIHSATNYGGLIAFQRTQEELKGISVHVNDNTLTNNFVIDDVKKQRNSWIFLRSHKLVRLALLIDYKAALYLLKLLVFCYRRVD